MNKKSQAMKLWAKRVKEKDPYYFKNLAKKNKDRSYMTGDNNPGFGRGVDASEAGKVGGSRCKKKKARR